MVANQRKNIAQNSRLKCMRASKVHGSRVAQTRRIKLEPSMSLRIFHSLEAPRFANQLDSTRSFVKSKLQAKNGTVILGHSQ